MKKSLPLDTYRKEIDLLDDQMINLLAKRFDIVEKIGQHKIHHDLPIYQTGRWESVLETAIHKGTQAGLSPTFIRHIWKVIHDHALYIQYKQKRDSLTTKN